MERRPTKALSNDIYTIMREQTQRVVIIDLPIPIVRALHGRERDISAFDSCPSHCSGSMRTCERQWCLGRGEVGLQMET